MTAITTFINALPVGTGLPYSQLFAIAFGVAGVANVFNVTLNSGTADITANNQQSVKVGTISVT